MYADFPGVAAHAKEQEHENYNKYIKSLMYQAWYMGCSRSGIRKLAAAFVVDNDEETEQIYNTLIND